MAKMPKTCPLPSTHRGRNGCITVDRHPFVPCHTKVNRRDGGEKVMSRLRGDRSSKGEIIL